MRWHWTEVLLAAIVVAFLGGMEVEKYVVSPRHTRVVREMPFIPSANRWQIFVAPPGEAEFSSDVTLGKTFQEAARNLVSGQEPVVGHNWTGPHWRVVDCRKPVDFGERWCNAVYR